MTGVDEGVPRGAWQEALEAITKEHEGDLATVEVAGRDLGDQFAAEQVPFFYVEYDRHDDAVSVGVGGPDGSDPVVLRHVVEHPQSILVHASKEGPVTVEVRAPDDTVTLIALSGRLELPA